MTAEERDQLVDQLTHIDANFTASLILLKEGLEALDEATSTYRGCLTLLQQAMRECRALGHALRTHDDGPSVWGEAGGHE